MKISVQELLIVLAIVLIIFGPTQIPKLMKLFKKNKQDSEKESKEEFPTQQILLCEYQERR